MASSQRCSAFTLIELSIVLVIIGLLVGGILVGRDMIEAAKARATISQLENFKTAMNTFNLKYDSLPGDLTQDQATAYGFQPTSRPDTAYGVTHGDGRLDADSPGGACTFWCYAILASETVLFWQDLSSAGLMSGFSQATDGPITTATVGTIDQFVPRTKLDDTYAFIYSTREPFAGYSSPPVVVPPATFIQLAGVSAIDSTGQMTVANTITPTQALGIDSKIDDGNPWTGLVLSAEQQYIAFHPSDFSGYSSGVDTSGCVQYSPQGPHSGVYRMTGNYASTPACQLSIRLF